MIRNTLGIARMWRRWTEFTGIGLALAAVIILLQLHVHAYSAEFGTDEASHYVSGLMIHAYLATGLSNGPLSPLAFLKNFHSHYALVGIGHWGPVFYIVEALWMLPFGCGRISVLLLSAAVTSAIGLVCYAVAAPRIGRTIAGLIAIAFVASRVAQEGSAYVMLDAPITLLTLLAALTYARYMEATKTRDAVAFALLAVIGLLIKGNAGCLALLPPLAMLISRRFDLLRRPSFWLPVPIVGCLAVPWYLLTYSLISQGFRYAWGLHYVSSAVRDNSIALLVAIGPLLLAAGLCGWVAVVWSALRSKADQVMTCVAALFAAVWIFQSVVPADIQDRYLEPAFPPLLILAGAALRYVLDRMWGRLPVALGRMSALATLLLAIVLAASMMPSVLSVTPKTELGFIEAVPLVWQQVETHNPVVLVVARQRVEDSAVAELAMHDPHCPSLFAVRGSRLLGGGGYNNSDYKPRFDTATEVMAAIDAYRIPLVLFRTDGSTGEWAHVRQVAEAMKLYPDRWEVVGRIEGHGPPVLLLRIRGNADKLADLAHLAELTAPRSLAAIP
jgi:4-amino-4-deoxy-L-arabinose transferase-like glycosyltransferase